MEFGSAFPPDSEPFELVEQSEGLLHDVAELAHALDVRGALTGNDRQDPTLAKLFPVGVGVVALVAEQSLRTPAWTAGRPATGGMPSTRARVCVTSLTFAAVVITLSGVPRPSQIKWCLLPVFRRSTGDGPVSAPPFSRGCGSRPRTLQRQQLPGYVVVQDVQDALQTQPISYRTRPRRLVRPGRQQRLDQNPQVVVHDPRPSAHTPTNGRITPPVTPNQGTSTRSCYELVGANAHEVAAPTALWDQGPITAPIDTQVELAESGARDGS
ncbi:hypothetical protein QF035_002213 [Streptomyces umbrinus]|uniref:Transposase n=1 Tax=Streptomyces umbrinus TaxID=67370 RepID=A0ABU0SM53_9ACTN|nr:hypothetical protein [Streptomyces umbrinus]